MHNTRTKSNQNLVQNKSSLIAAQNQLITFDNWKCDSLTTTKNPSSKHKSNKTINEIKLHNMKKPVNMKTLCFKILNYQKWFEITQLEIISHDKICQSMFTPELVSNKINQFS